MPSPPLDVDPGCCVDFACGGGREGRRIVVVDVQVCCSGRGIRMSHFHVGISKCGGRHFEDEFVCQVVVINSLIQQSNDNKEIFGRWMNSLLYYHLLTSEIAAA